MEGGTADFIKDHDFEDDIPDVPFAKDLYDELIPEKSSHMEESASYYTRGFLNKNGQSRAYDDSDLGSTRKDELMGTIRASHADGGLDLQRSYDKPLLDSHHKNIRRTGKKVNPSNMEQPLRMSTSPANKKLLIDEGHS